MKTENHWNRVIPYLMVGGAAALWGAIGIFIDILANSGFSTIDIVALRVLVSAVLLGVWLRFRNPTLLRIEWKDLWLFFGTGVLSILFFNWSYFTAIRETSLSVAVVLLYTGPAFVVLMARVAFKEFITARKQAALFMTLVGIILVSELYPRGGEISAFGLTVGIGAGFGYALYSIFSKLALKKYKPFTILFYTFLVASIAVLPVSSLYTPETASRMLNTNISLTILAMALLPTILAYFLYTEGLRNLEAGKASITAMTEPVAATLLGLWLFQEVLSLWQVGGMALVLFSVLMIQKPKKT